MIEPGVFLEVTFIIEFQLSACRPGVFLIPVSVSTHRPPLSIQTDLHTTVTVTITIHNTYITIWTQGLLNYRE